LIEALGALLHDPTRDPAFVAECHALPDVWTLADQCEAIDLDAIVREREDLLDELAEAHADRYDAAYRACAQIAPAAITAPAIAARRLKNLALMRLTRLDPQAKLAQQQFADAKTMTDRLSALTALLHYDAPTARTALAEFRARWRDDPLVTDKWLAALLTRPQPEAVDDLLAVLGDDVWQPRNPNRVRAVLGSFGRSNPIAFHRRDGAGYRAFCAQLPGIDALNPQVCARQLTALEPWRRLDPERRAQIEPLLRGLQQQLTSRDAQDVAGRLLG
jgi:aminopeptidase N